MDSFIKKDYLDQSELVVYTMLKAHNGKYLRVHGGKIYADGPTREDDPNVEYDYSYMFKLSKKYDEVHNEYYFEIMNGDMYFKTDPFNYTVYLANKQIGDKGDLFKYQIVRYGNSDDDRRRLLIYSYMDQPWGEDFDNPITERGKVAKYSTQQFGKTFAYKSVEAPQPGEKEGFTHWIPYRGVKRYWSTYDGYKPIRIWDGDTNVDGEFYDNLVKCNGVLWKNCRMGQPGRSYPNNSAKPKPEDALNGEVYKTASNNYIFMMDNGTGADFNSVLLGYDGKIRWVQYHNEFYDKLFNSTMSPKLVIDSVKPNFLVDVPYETKFDNEEKTLAWLMSSGRQRIDLTQTKNTETPNYRYALKGNTDGE